MNPEKGLQLEGLVERASEHLRNSSVGQCNDRMLVRDLRDAITTLEARVGHLEAVSADTLNEYDRAMAPLQASEAEREAQWHRDDAALQKAVIALQASEARVKHYRDVLGQIAAGHQPPESIGVHWAQAYRGLQSIAQAALTSGGEGLTVSTAHPGYDGERAASAGSTEVGRGEP